MKTRLFFTGVLSLLMTMAIGITTSSAQVTGTRASTSTRQVQRLLTRIETKIEILKDEADRASTRGGRQNQNTDADTSELSRYLDDLNTSVTRLDDTLDTRQAIDSDVREAMLDATVVDQYMTRNRVSVAAQAQWRSLKRDFNTLATYNRLSWNWNQTIPTGPNTGSYPSTGGYPNTSGRPYDISDAQVEALITRIQNNTEVFERQALAALNDTRTGDPRDARSMTDNVTALETSTFRLKQHFDARQSTDADVRDVLTQATVIDQYMSRHDLSYEAESGWRNLRADLSNLAAGYRVSWNWNQTTPTYPGNNGPLGGRRLDTALTGTYRLNTRLSEDVSAAVDRAFGNYPATDQTQRDRLQRRLQSPDMIVIEKNNASVTMASTNLPRVTFQADGVARTETSPNGRTITTTASADADSLIINYQGDRSNEFYVTFAPTVDGQLRVTRRVYSDNSSQPVTVTSVYDKVDTVARWNMITMGTDTTATTVTDTFVIPNGTRLNAVLSNSISSSGIQAADRVVLDVTTPTQYRGARITGRIISEDASVRTAGRARVLVSFDSIRLPNGQSYRFGGVVNGVISADGDNISVAQQAPVRQTRTNGIGNILGALIGAISGQPIEQAATGVSGSILTQMRDVFSLREGSQFIITASSDTTSVNQLR